MNSEKYKQWLGQQTYHENTITAQLHRVGKVEEYYGDLDEHFEKDQLKQLISNLSYSKNDQRNNLPNPSKINFNGDSYKNLASYKGAVKLYSKYKLDDSIILDDLVDGIVVGATNTSAVAHKQSLSLERDMQASLRLTIDKLENGLVITDEGVERSVDSGFIDITAKDSKETTVVIELKTGTASQSAVAQILSYMGDVMSEEEGNQIRGILVASQFDSKAISAARMVPTLRLVKYAVQFAFMDAVE